MKKIVSLVVSFVFIMLTFVGCAPVKVDVNNTSINENESTIVFTGKILEDTEFGGVYFDVDSKGFAELGFKHGDSCNIEFSNGKSFEDVPFYSGYFALTDEPIIVDYQGYKYIEAVFCNGNPMWKECNCKEGDTVTVSINKSGKYQKMQDSMDMTYSSDRKDYSNDIEFANFRVMNGASLAFDMFFRGASPINNHYNRADYVDKLIEENGIKFILDLADNEEKIEKYTSSDTCNSPYFLKLYNYDNVALLNMNASYRTKEYGEKLVKGLNVMSQHEGPYYIHCTEGKDRTGFVCILIECVAGYSYEQIETDYMESYNNYFKISKESKPDVYNLLVDLRLNDMVLWLAGVDKVEDLKNVDLGKCAKQYLINAGMTEEEYLSFEKIVKD